MNHMKLFADEAHLERKQSVFRLMGINFFYRNNLIYNDNLVFSSQIRALNTVRFSHFKAVPC